MKTFIFLLVTYFMYVAPLTPVTYAADLPGKAELRGCRPQEKQEKKEKKEQKETRLKKSKIKIIPKKPAASTTIKNLSKPTRKYTGEKGDFIFYNADLQNVMLFFAKQYNLNMIIDPGVSGKVTCRMIQVPWDQALNVILKQHNLTMIVESTISQAKKLKK